MVSGCRDCGDGIDADSDALIGDCVVSGGEDKTVKLWRISTEECFLTLTGHKEEVHSVAFSPDGSHIASGSLDKTIRTYRVTSV